jgi:RNA polymerase sigma factor (sigma-70 family)
VTDPTGEAADEALVARSRHGDHAALSQLFARHAPGIARLCRRLTGPALAEDCAQDALILAMLRLEQLREPAAFGAWLRGIALHVCRRARSRVEPYPLPPPEVLSLVAPDDVEQSLADSLSARDTGRTVRAAIDTLPTGQRDAVAAFYLAGRSYEEAADALGIPVGALKTRLHKARLALKQHFGLSPSPSARRFDDRTLAVHEASHAVVYFLHGGLVSRLSVQPRAGGYLGFVKLRPIAPPLGAAPLRTLIQSSMAGEAGVAIAQPGRQRHDTTDRAAAARVARIATGGDDVEAALYVADALEAARARLSVARTWSMVERVAAALTARRDLDADDFQSLVAG